VTRRLRLHPLTGVEQELRQSSYLPAEIDEIETGTLAPECANWHASRTPTFLYGFFYWEVGIVNSKVSCAISN